MPLMNLNKKQDEKERFYSRVKYLNSIETYSDFLTEKEEPMNDGILKFIESFCDEISIPLPFWIIPEPDGSIYFSWRYVTPNGKYEDDDIIEIRIDRYYIVSYYSCNLDYFFDFEKWEQDVVLNLNKEEDHCFLKEKLIQFRDDLFVFPNKTNELDDFWCFSEVKDYKNFLEVKESWING